MNDINNTMTNADGLDIPAELKRPVEAKTDVVEGGDVVEVTEAPATV